jgi:hypothetical protein
MQLGTGSGFWRDSAEHSRLGNFSRRAPEESSQGHWLRWWGQTCWGPRPRIKAICWPAVAGFPVCRNTYTLLLHGREYRGRNDCRDVLSAQNGPSEQAEVKKTAVAFFCAQKMACVLLGGGILNHTRRALRTHVIMTFQILINRNS